MMVSFPDVILNRLRNGGTSTACCINDQFTTYSEFYDTVGSIQARIHRSGSPVIGIITQNHPGTYATIVASWLTGKAWVPINPEYPAERTSVILEEAGIRHIFYAEETQEIQEFQNRFGELQFCQSADLPAAEPFNTYPSSDKTAYILFTSGTTGKPKGVPITFGNLQAFLNAFHNLGYELSESDRFLQMFDLTFDLSVMSFTVPLIHGASFYTLPTGMIKTLGLYHVLDSYGITFSLMVPSAINLLSPYLEDVDLPQLKYSQFCGEALKADLLERWAKCIPNARIDNVYGPTEATIYCTSQTVNRERPADDSLNGIVSIGKPMQDVTAEIFSEQMRITAAGVQGELCISGPQVTPGYLNNPVQNEKSFFIHENEKYYRTGDLVTRSEEGTIFYIGRIDDQVKIQGYRIELAEIELAAGRVIPGHTSVAVGFQDATETWKLALFIQNLSADPEIIRSEIAAHIPDYMVPHHILSIDEFPLNSNGKTDKKMLRQFAIDSML